MRDSEFKYFSLSLLLIVIVHFVYYFAHIELVMKNCDRTHSSIVRRMHLSKY